MLSDQNLKTARALIDAFNRAHDMTAWQAALAQDFVADYPGAHGLNVAQARGYNESFLNASDDIHFDVQRVIAEGNTAVFQCTAGATLTHPLVTPAATFPATGKGGPAVPFVLIVDLKDGKIVREETVWNQLEVFQAWGLLPSAAAA
jgi:ketosteroid isomerase-like protein